MRRLVLLVSAALFAAASVHAGSWDVGSFDNDAALDWVNDLERTSDTAFLSTTLRQVHSNAKFIDDDTCSSALAAAEVVAAARGRPAKSLPAEVGDWLKRVQPKVGAELLASARSAVETCRDDEASDLRHLLQDSDYMKQWLDATADLLSRLS